MNPFKTILSIAVLSNFNLAFGQTDSIQAKNKFVITLSAGSAMPLGKYATYERDETVNKGFNVAGAAQNGINLNASLRYLFPQKIGFILSYDYTSNKTETLSHDEIFPPPLHPALGGGSKYTSFFYDARNWNVHNFLLGFFAQFGDEKAFLILRFAGGCQQVISPETVVNVEGYSWPIAHSYSYSVSQPKMVSNNFVFETGVDLQVKLIRNLSIIASMDYFTSKAIFNGTSNFISEYSDGVNITHIEGTDQVNYIKNISMFCLNAGLSFTFK